MQSKVILHVRKGKAEQERYEFEERATVQVGRWPDSGIKVPDDVKQVSRRHCLIDINPPDISVRDMGSLFGTHINGALIGRREPQETPEEGRKRAYSAFPLGNGDRLQLAENGGSYALELVVERIVVPVCDQCGDEIPGDQRARCEVLPDRFRCLACQRKTILRPHNTGESEGNIVRQLIELLRQNPDEPNLGALTEYEILAEIGNGATSHVYRALHRPTGMIVALKVMKPMAAVGRRARLSFERECENMAALNDPNVVRIRSAGRVQGVYYFDMELCNAESVANLLGKAGPLPVAQALDFARQMLIGLEYAHTAPIPKVRTEDGEYRSGKGLVHRDIKPGNLLLHQEGGRTVLKVADFGLAKAFDLAGMSGMTQVGERAGTPGYMCRQQADDLVGARPEVDVWSAAASLYSMLTACVAKRFGGEDPWIVIKEHRAVPIQDRREEFDLPPLPSELAAVIDMALDDQGSLPFRSARALREALERAAS